MCLNLKDKSKCKKEYVFPAWVRLKARWRQSVILRAGSHLVAT